MKLIHILMFLLLVTFNSSTRAEQTGTEFTYQGELIFQNEKADGNFDFAFDLYDGPTSEDSTPGWVFKPGVSVSNGIFTVELDFGSLPFTTGQQQWLEISVRQAGSEEAHTVLSPRQKLTAAPYALQSLQAEKDYGKLVIAGDGQIIGTYYSGRALTNTHYWIPYYSDYGLILAFWTFYPEPNCEGQPYQITDNYNSNGQVFRIFSETNGYELSYVHKDAEPVNVTVLSAMETSAWGGGQCKSRSSTQQFYPVLPNDPNITGAPNDWGTIEFPYPLPITLIGSN